MQIGFVCPDAGKIKHEACLRFGGCRLKERCATIPYLKHISKTRAWTGKPSVTQLIKGTCEAYLLITTPYYVFPGDMAFATHGSLHHVSMEEAAKAMGHAAEIEFKKDDITGISDYLMPNEYGEDGGYILYDYKTSGSYKVAQWLGLEKIEVETGEYYKSGKRKDQAKVRKEIRQDDSKIKMNDLKLQLNAYRMKFERKPNIRIVKQVVQATVRDGGTYIATSRGIDRNLYLIDVPIMSNDEVKSFFIRKRDALLSALQTNTTPPPCTEEERWGDRKCKRYCHVAFACPYGREVISATEFGRKEG